MKLTKIGLHRDHEKVEETNWEECRKEIDLCKKFISLKTTSISRWSKSDHCMSYALKHRVEEWRRATEGGNACVHIWNGVFIKAAEELGIEYKMH